MNTILTDDEIATAIAHLYAGPEVLAMALPDELHSARAVEAAVLAKLAQQEPVAWYWTLDGEFWDLAEKVDEFSPKDRGFQKYPLYLHPAPQHSDRQQVPPGARCKVIDDCKSCAHAIGRITCTLADRDFSEGETPQKGKAPPSWCPLAAAPEAPAQAIPDYPPECDPQPAPEEVVRHTPEAPATNCAHMRPMNKVCAPCGRYPNRAQASAVDERAAFEAWAKAYGRVFLEVDPKLGRNGVTYKNQFTQEAWVGWQARAALAQKGGK